MGTSTQPLPTSFNVNYWGPCASRKVHTLSKTWCTYYWYTGT